MEAILHEEDSMEVEVAGMGQSSEESPDWQEACKGVLRLTLRLLGWGSPGGFELKRRLMTVE